VQREGDIFYKNSGPIDYDTYDTKLNAHLEKGAPLGLGRVKIGGYSVQGRRHEKSKHEAQDADPGNAEGLYGFVHYNFITENIQDNYA